MQGNYDEVNFLSVCLV